MIFFFGPYYSWSDHPAFSELDAFTFSQLPSIIGVSAFLLAIHAAVISFAEETSNDNEIRSALRWGCICVVITNVILAFVGYLLWGSEVKGYIFCNVESSRLITAMKGLLVVELLCSLPLALRPNTEIVEKALKIEEGGTFKLEIKVGLSSAAGEDKTSTLLKTTIHPALAFLALFSATLSESR